MSRFNTMPQSNFQPLDIAACYGTGFTDRAISYGTASLLAPPRLRIGPSHVAVLCEFRDSMVWIESTTLCKHPCAILGYQVDGCQAHLPEDRIRDYITTGGHVDLYRLSPIESLSQSESELLTTILVRHFIGQRVTYDLGGALVFAGHSISRFNFNVRCTTTSKKPSQRFGWKGPIIRYYINSNCILINLLRIPPAPLLCF